MQKLLPAAQDTEFVVAVRADESGARDGQIIAGETFVVRPGENLEYFGRDSAPVQELADPIGQAVVGAENGLNPVQPDLVRRADVEEALDVEWAHSIAPQANIILFEANSASYTFLAFKQLREPQT